MALTFRDAGDMMSPTMRTRLTFTFVAAALAAGTLGTRAQTSAAATPSAAAATTPSSVAARPSASAPATPRVGAPPSATMPWSVDFETSARSAPAKDHFIRGLTLMHLFMYLDAAREFQAAQKADPAFAMAYWGEAMTYYRPIWREYVPEPATEVVLRLGATPAARAAKAPTAREKAYVAALDVLYPSGELGSRLRNYPQANESGQLRRYAEAMAAIVTAYPSDDEAQALWAVARVVQFERTDAEMPERMKTAAIAAEVLRRNPNHPGAPRYFIQSVDDPVHADLGAAAARLYIAKNPDGPEARHLPTHISTQLGLWKEMAELNWQAFELSMDWTQRNGFKLQDLNNHDYGHLLTYAQYGYLQLGQYGRARTMIDRARKDYEASGHAPEIASTLAGTLAQYIVETHDGERVAALRQLVDEARVPGANLRYALALASASSGDPTRARQEAAALDARTTSARIMRAELEALVATAAGERDKALELLKGAAASDVAQIYTHFGPPVPYKPPHEMYGELLLSAARPADALKVFQEGMRIYRRRTGLLLGASRAAAAANQPALAQKYAGELREIWREADGEVAGLAEVRRSNGQ